MKITCPHCNEHISLKVDKPSKRGEPNPLWDAVCEVFNMTPVTTREKTRVGRVVSDLKLKRAIPEDVRERTHRYINTYPKCACTPEAVLKHWDALSDVAMLPLTTQPEYGF